jgi:GMP synthase-like glutamine amidotransferase
LIENVRIGQYKVKTVRKSALTSKTDFYSYFLNSKTAALSDKFEVLGQSGRLPCMIRHEDKEFYGCLFHPEVLNPEIIENFAKT